MHLSTRNTAAVDIAQQQCSRAWSLLRVLGGQFSDETGKFEGDGADALEIIYTAMDLNAEASEQVEVAHKTALANQLIARMGS